jgi:hypothetical protein
MQTFNQMAMEFRLTREEQDILQYGMILIQRLSLDGMIERRDIPIEISLALKHSR